MATATELERNRTFSNQEAESLLFTPIRRGWERGGDARLFNNNHDTSRFNDLVAESPQMIQNPLNSATQKPIAEPAIDWAKPDESPFQSYIKPGERAYMPTQVAEVEEVGLEKIMEVELEEVAPIQRGKIERANARVIEEEEELDLANATVKLNARGVIAIVAFFATILLVTVLIIINATSISGAGARISRLREENAVLSANVNQALSTRNEAYNSITNNITNQFNSQTGSQRYIIGNGNSMQMVQLPPVVQLPPIETWRPSNPDHSTNWFNNLSRWLSNLFR